MKKSKLNFELPTHVEVGDYHDFYQIQDVLRHVTKLPIKVEEMGFDNNSRSYIELVYVGNRRVGANNVLRKQLIKRCTDSTEELWGC